VARARVQLRAGADSTRLGVGTRWGAGDLGHGKPWAARGLGRRARRRGVQRSGPSCFAGAVFEIELLQIFVQKSAK
jgi:hypothetical protein